MKQLLKKKWFRILARVAIGGVTLVVLAYTAFNWWAAGQKASAIADARAAGFPLTVRELMADMPPDAENAARNGILGQLEDEYSKDWSGKEIPPANLINRFRSLGDSEMMRAFNRQRRDGARIGDFSLLPEGGPYGRTARSFLTEYDRRNSAMLEELKAGFTLPQVRRAIAPAGHPGGVEWVNLSEGFGLDSKRVEDGLRLRAIAALEVGEPEKAAETFVLMIRLGELIGSRDLVVSVLIEFAALREMKIVLKAGIEGGQWGIGDLNQFSEALGRWDIRRHVKRGIESEILMTQVWEGWKQAPEHFSPNFSGVGENSSAWYLKMKTAWFPSGWFDLCGAEVVRQTMQSSEIAKDPGPAIRWWDGAIQLQAAREAKNSMAKSISFAPAGPVLLKKGARYLVDLHLMLTACGIERYRLEHGSYPERLDELPPQLRTDPLLGTDFRYSVKDGAFSLYSIGPDGVDGGGISNEHRAYEETTDWIW